MKKSILAIVLLSAAVLFMPSAAVSQNLVYEQQPNYVEVSGSSYRNVTPDKIEISISLRESDSKGKTTLAQMENTLIRTLNDLGIDPEKALKVTDQSSNYKKRADVYQFKNYLLTVSSAAMVADVFDRLSAAGISNAEVINATLTNLEQVQSEVKVEAIRNAQANAKLLAQAIGQNIGKAIYIQDYSSPMVYRGALSKSIAYESADGAMNAPVLEFKDMRVEQRVTVRFLLE